MKFLAYEAAHAARIRELAAECTVLLKKDDQFPLDGPCRLVLAGNGARNTIKGGTGSGDVESHYFVTVEEGLKAAGFTITSQPWLDACERVQKQQEDAFRSIVRERVRKIGFPGVFYKQDPVELASAYDFELNYDGDAAVYVLSRTSGEGSDRTVSKGDYQLTDIEIRDILILAEHFPRFMLVLNVGGPIDLSEVMDQVPNILLLSQLGVVTGDVLADILLGRGNPSGKLTTTWAPIEDYPSTRTFGGYDDTPYDEGIFVGYRYFETVHAKTIFPFGFGLSYTAFELSDPLFEVQGKQVRVRIRVRNTGRFAGKEVVQLYVSKPAGRLAEPARHLAGYTKTALLAPGEEETLILDADMECLASYDPEISGYILKEGDYTFHIGTQVSETVPCGIVHFKKEILLRQLKPVGGQWTGAEMNVEPAGPDVQKPDNVPVIEMDEHLFELQTVSYDLPDKEDPFLSSLSDSELAYLCIGHFNPDKKSLMIGNSGTKVCGAGGETTHQLKEKGLEDFLVMADGPAGLRLAREYGRDEEGVFPVAGGLVDMIENYLTDEIREQVGYGKRYRERRERCAVQTQYCTAIPIGTAVAMSFNDDLAEQLGDIVGTEMEMFGVHLWLAPGMNIHRNPLCGRNFEYYSEDPLVAGRTAAAITRGVQKHPGCGTVLKHFCCNNQEFRRLNSNSQVDERTLREIYMRGFEIAIRQSAPHAIMTSYNLLNGVHVCERSDLMKDFLRAEAGFDGLIMTDWTETDYSVKDGKYRCACAAPTIKAGNDLFMPGSTADYNDIMQALDTGKLSEKDLLRNAGHVIRTIRILCSAKQETPEIE